MHALNVLLVLQQFITSLLMQLNAVFLCSPSLLQRAFMLLSSGFQE